MYSLLALYESDGLSQQEICNIYNLDEAAVGRCLKKLEDKDFISREPDPEDRRFKRAYLEARGENFRLECMERLENIENTLVSSLDEKEIKNLEESLKKICGSIEGNRKGEKSQESNGEKSSRSPAEVR